MPLLPLVISCLIAGIDAFQVPLSTTSQQPVVARRSPLFFPQNHISPPALSAATLDIADAVETKNELDEDKKFDWFKAWYPVVPVEFLDVEKPHHFKLLGIDIVVWNDGPMDKSPQFGPRKNRAKGATKQTGEWRAFVDQCPHRMVPLSEGRIEDDGSLLCSYHGWRFDGDGCTIDVPQLSKNDVERIRSNPKSNCNSFPVRIIEGVLWVWPDSSSDSKIESALTDVPTLPLDDDVNEKDIFKGTWNFRELPYGHDFFIENVVDPAHVPVSHHNIVGSRYDSQTMTMTTQRSLKKDGFKVGVKTENQMSTTEFNAPSQVVIKSDVQGALNILELYSSPSRPGFCNHVGRIVIVKDKDGNMPSFLSQYTLPIPKWLNHIAASSFLNQDALFLHAQERSLAHNAQYRSSAPGVADDYGKATLLCATDRGVVNFRKWIQKMAGGNIPFRGDTAMPETSKETVFDVWNSHTKNCSHCQTALKNLKKARFASFFAAAFLAVVRPRKIGIIGTAVSALLLSALGGALNKLIGMFYRYEFSHADNH